MMMVRRISIMKKTIILISAVIMLLFMTGCGKYTTSYKAVGFVHTNEKSSARMSFYSFEGRIVFKLKSPGEGELKYTGRLESGKASVYYDFYGTKTELFSISDGEEVDAKGGYVEAGTVYVSVETDGKCVNGDFSFQVVQ